MQIAADGFPTGHATPEGAAADLARVFIDRDEQAFTRVIIRPYSGGESNREYLAFREQVASSIRAEKSRDVPSPNGPRAIGKVFAARHLTAQGSASYGYASFGFQDIMFVDVGVVLHDGQRALNRTLVIKDKDGKWYSHPAPQVSPLLSKGLNAESPSRIDFSQAYKD